MLGVARIDARCEGTVTYHDSCSSLRQCGVREEPRRLLGSVEGLALKELSDAETCCGFGGTFCVKYPDISNAMVVKKAANVAASGADMLLGGDLGCLMNIAGKLTREGKTIAVRHVAEVLAGQLDQPPIGVARDSGHAQRGRRAGDPSHDLATLQGQRQGRARRSQLQHALHFVETNFPQRRRNVADMLPEFDALRDSARDIKNHTLSFLDLYLEAFEARATARGSRVHYAVTAEEANRIVADIVASTAPRRSPRAKRWSARKSG